MKVKITNWQQNIILQEIKDKALILCTIHHLVNGICVQLRNKTVICDILRVGLMHIIVLDLVLPIITRILNHITILSHIVHSIRKDVAYQLKHMQSDIKNSLNINVSYQKAWHGVVVDKQQRLFMEHWKVFLLSFQIHFSFASFKPRYNCAVVP